MKALTNSFECGKIAPKFRFTDHYWFFSFGIEGESHYPRVSFHLDNLQTIVNLKNNFLSAFNKAMKEAGYDK